MLVRRELGHHGLARTRPVGGGDQAQLARERHRTAPAHRRGLPGVVPVAQPPDQDPPPVGGVVEGDAGVAIPAVVQPAAALRREDLPVEVTDPPAHPAATAGGAAQHADQQHPADVRRSLDRQREEVRALPGSGRQVRVGELAQQGPLVEVVARIEDDLLLHRLDGRHHPAVAVTEHLRVPEVRRAPVEHRVGGVLDPRLPVVAAASQVLGLRAGLGRQPDRRVDRHQVGAVVDRGPGEDVARPDGRRRRRTGGSPPGVRPTTPGRRRPRGPSSCRPSRRRSGCAGRTGASAPRGRPARWGR